MTLPTRTSLPTSATSSTAMDSEAGRKEGYIYLEVQISLQDVCEKLVLVPRKSQGQGTRFTQMQRELTSTGRRVVILCNVFVKWLFGWYIGGQNFREKNKTKHSD